MESRRSKFEDRSRKYVVCQKLLPGRTISKEKDRNEVCRNSGFPGPDSLGITREAWNATEPSPGVVYAHDSVSPVTQEDKTEFAYSVSYPPSSSESASGSSCTDPAPEQATRNDGVSAYTLRNAPNVSHMGEQHGEHKQRRLHERASYLDMLVRPSPQRLESSVSKEFSDLLMLSSKQDIRVFANQGSSKHPSKQVLSSKPLLVNRISEYPGPAMHLEPARSLSIPIPSNEKKRSDSVLGGDNVLVMESRICDRVSGRSGDPGPVVTREAPPEHYLSPQSDRASISLEQRYLPMKQEMRLKEWRVRYQLLPPFEPTHGGSAKETHGSVKVLGKQKTEADSEEEVRHEDDKKGVSPLPYSAVMVVMRGHLLGRGSFGPVYEAVDRNGSFFAVEEVSLVDNDLYISQLEQEIQVLTRCRHESLIQYFGTRRENGKLYIFMELLSRVSLASMCKQFKFTTPQVVACTRQILKGLKYLHSMNVVHRDIKCANIYVDTNGTCKLANFGFKKQISDQFKSCVENVYWRAPEVTDRKKTWPPADIWSLGCSIVEMFMGRTPFENQEWDQVLLTLAHGEAPPIPEHLPDDAKDFIRQCLNVNPTKRPTARALLQHKFLSTKVLGGPLLADLDWSPTASGNSVVGTQSPCSPSKEMQKISEQSRGQQIEAESTSVNKLCTESFQRGVQSERKDTARYAKRRALPKNLTKSEDIKHMTPSIGSRDIIADRVVWTDSDKTEPLCAQKETNPVNLMDPKELSATSNTSLRPDVVALGFQSFNHEFDAERVLCIYNVSDSHDAVEILFFHVEGMALLFGVGLPFSCVLLQKDIVVEVKQLKQQVWMESWSKSEMSKFSLILLNSSTFSAPTTRLQSAPRHTVQALLPEQAAEQFGVGLEGGDSYIKMGEFQHDASNTTPISPSWISSLYDFLRCRIHERADSQEKKIGSEHNLRTSFTTTDLFLPSSSDSAQGTTLHENDQHIQGQELHEVTAIEHGVQSQPLHLTIIIYLDPEDCTFYSALVETEMRLDRESSNPQFVHCETGEVMPIVDPALCEFLMEPKVTINFWYYPYLEGSGSKKMETTLDVNFLIEGEVSDPDKFGWYHDRLRLSFKCTRPNDVRREPRESEILSKHEIRTADRGYARGNSTAALEGKGKEYQVFVGVESLASLQIGRTSISKKENTVGSSENQELFAKISAVCLVDANFSIRKVERRSELAYLATIFPSFHLYSVWNCVDRDHAHNSGMMSAVRIQIEGGWQVREDNDDNLYTSNSSTDNSGRFCRYEFSCQRELKLLQKSHVGRENQVKKRFLPIIRNHAQELIWETKEKLITLDQKLLRSFLVNHSFSHMQRLERPYAYVWDMVGRSQAPCPRPADQMLQ